MENTIKISSHHLGCIPRFYRGGYDQKFAGNMKKICTQIRENPNFKIKVVVAKPDDLCDKCPYLHSGQCVQSIKLGRGSSNFSFAS